MNREGERDEAMRVYGMSLGQLAAAHGVLPVRGDARSETYRLVSIDEVPLKWCRGCYEDWPDDDEFYRPGAVQCIACEDEIIARRRSYYARAARRYRQRLREAMEGL